MMAGATVVLLAILAFLLLSDPNANSSRLPSTRFAGAIRPESPPAHFALQDQDGKLISASSLRGQPVIVAFLYSTCRDSCPTIAQQIRGALDRLGRDIPVVAISVDPANDTPASAKRFLAAQHLGGRMNFLLGTAQTLQPVWREFGIEPQKTGREHTATVVLLDAEGHQRIGFPLSELTPEGIAHDVRVLEREAAAQGTSN